MKIFRPTLHLLPWIGMTLVIAVVVTTGLLTNITLRSVKKTLPNQLLLELNDLSIAFEHLSETAALAEVTKAAPSTENMARLRNKVETVYRIIVELRESYVFDNMIQASAFHAVVAPAIADVRIWLAEGISGYEPQSDTTIAIVQSRISEASEKAKCLNRASRKTAQKILNNQSKRLDRFLSSVNLLFISTLGITVLIVFLLIRQQRLRRREMDNLEALRQAQRSLQESEELHSKLIATLPDIVIRTDMDGIIQYINDVGLHQSGYQESEIAGRNMITFIAPEDRPQVVENTIHMMNRPLGPREYHLVMKDGRKRRFEVNGDVLRDTNGTPYGLVHVCRDVSERQRLAEERQKLQERLHRAEKMEALGMLAGGVAHDLNNVLGVLVGYSELMLMEIPEEHPLRKHVTNILDSGQRGAAIIQDLLTLARRGVAAAEVVNLNTLIVNNLKTPEFLKLRSTFPNIHIETEREKALLNIKGSPIHLSKTILNLVFNAVESIEDHGQVLIKTENRHLDQPMNGYDAMLDGDYVVLSVTDTGKGISKQDLEKIFEPFFTKKVMGRSGTGLGLAVVWGTVKDHGGYVDVRSQDGMGTTFTLYFPATHENEKKIQGSISPDRYAGNGESILVVDDVPKQRELAQHMLEKIGYRVNTVPSGEAAVDFLKTQKKVDLVLLDMIMDPGIDGLETYRRIRDIRPDQKTIIVSGYAETERVKKALSMGAGAYVRKPYLLERLGTAVRNELDSA